MKQKLEPIGKEKIIITKKGEEFHMDYNKRMTLDYSDFANMKLVNKLNNKTVLYSEAITMIDSKGTVYIFTPEDDDIYITNNIYKIDNWLFENDVRLKHLKEDKRITQLENKTSGIEKSLAAIADILPNITSTIGAVLQGSRTALETSGRVVEEGLGLIRDLEKHVQNLQQIMATGDTTKNGKNHIVQPQPSVFTQAQQMTDMTYETGSYSFTTKF